MLLREASQATGLPAVSEICDPRHVEVMVTNVDMLQVGIEPDGDGCQLTLTHELHPDWAAYEAFTRKAWDSMFDLLAAVLAGRNG